jgi:hypothetical protein
VKCDIHDMRAAAFALSVIAALVLMGVLGALATASRSKDPLEGLGSSSDVR